MAGNLPGSADDGFRRIPSLAPLCLDVRDQKTATPVAGDQPATKKLVDIAGSCFCFFSRNDMQYGSNIENISSWWFQPL